MFRRLAPLLLTPYLLVSMAALADPSGPGAAARPEDAARSDRDVADSAAATYRLTPTSPRIAIDEATVASWRAYHPNRGAEPSREQSIRQALRIELLAQTARAADVHREPRVALALERVEHVVLIAALKNQISRRLTIPETAIKSRYNARLDHYVRPPTKRLQNIFLRFPVGAEENAKVGTRAKMATLRDALEQGADFAALASEHSDSQSRFRGGVIGYVHAGQLPEPVAAAVMHLEPGELSAPVESADGITLFRCDAEAPARNVTFAEARDRLESVLRAAAFEEAWEALTTKQQAAAAPVIDWKVVENRQAPDHDVAVRATAFQLRRDQLAALLEGEPTSRSREDVASAVAAYGEDHMMALEARRLGLHRHEKTKRRLHWREREVLATEWMRQRVEALLVPLTDDEIRAYWKSHSDHFRKSARYRLSAIRLPVDPDNERSSHDVANRLVDQLRGHAIDFAETATRYSDLPSATNGGDMGWVDRPGLASKPNLFKTVERLAVGEVSRAVEQDGRLWILRVDATEDPRPMTYDEARSLAENRLGNERVRALQLRVESELIASAEIQVNPPGP